MVASKRLVTGEYIFLPAMASAALHSLLDSSSSSATAAVPSAAAAAAAAAAAQAQAPHKVPLSFFFFFTVSLPKKNTKTEGSQTLTSKPSWRRRFRLRWRKGGTHEHDDEAVEASTPCCSVTWVI